MIPNIYVAGPSKELERCQHWIARLKQEGFCVTYDWTVPVAEFGSAGEKLEDSQLRSYVRSDLRGIDEAHILWVLAPSPDSHTIGAWFEFGYAFATFTQMGVQQRSQILVSPPVSERCLFALLPLVTECETDEEAFEAIQRWPA